LVNGVYRKVTPFHGKMGEIELVRLHLNQKFRTIVKIFYDINSELVSFRFDNDEAYMWATDHNRVMYAQCFFPISDDSESKNVYTFKSGPVPFIQFDIPTVNLNAVIKNYKNTMSAVLSVIIDEKEPDFPSVVLSMRNSTAFTDVSIKICEPDDRVDQCFESRNDVIDPDCTFYTFTVASSLYKEQSALIRELISSEQVFMGRLSQTPNRVWLFSRDASDEECKCETSMMINREYMESRCDEKATLSSASDVGDVVGLYPSKYMGYLENAASLCDTMKLSIDMEYSRLTAEVSLDSVGMQEQDAGKIIFMIAPKIVGGEDEIGDYEEEFEKSGDGNKRRIQQEVDNAKKKKLCIISTEVTARITNITDGMKKRIIDCDAPVV
jgi:hypothetical protein